MTHAPRFTCQSCGKYGYGKYVSGGVAHRPDGWSLGYVCAECQSSPRARTPRRTMDEAIATRPVGLRLGGVV